MKGTTPANVFARCLLKPNSRDDDKMKKATRSKLLLGSQLPGHIRSILPILIKFDLIRALLSKERLSMQMNIHARRHILLRGVDS